jgi:hypothetical protein
MRHLTSRIVIFLLGVATGVLALLIRNRPREVMVYPIVQIGNSRPYAGALAVYRTDVPHQDVMFWSPGNVESPSRLLDCAVRDAKSWRCEDDMAGVKAVVEMQMGKFEKTALAIGFKEHGVDQQLWREAWQAPGHLQPPSSPNPSAAWF